MPLNHTMMKTEVKEAAITRAIIAASRRPLLGSITSAYKNKEYYAALHHVKKLEIDFSPKMSFQLQSGFIQVVAHLLSQWFRGISGLVPSRLLPFRLLSQK